MKKEHNAKCELTGAERDAVLEQINKQVTEWGLTMSNDDPLPFHFGLDYLC